jgi:molybdopterin-guanine dinucleotide biosynthesis protein A
MTLNAGGILLCGGQSRRMGQSKAMLPFGNELMVQRLARILGEVVQPVVVVAALGQDVPKLFDSVEVVRDELQGRGPLQGLAAGLRRMQQLGVDVAYATSTDVPFLKVEFVKRVIELLGNASVAVPFVHDRYHPLAAAYRTACLPAIDRLLEIERLRPVYLFEQVATRVIDAAELGDVDSTLQSLRNLNSPEDYQLALQDYSSGAAG